jgi:hypothetical protein
MAGRVLADYDSASRRSSVTEVEASSPLGSYSLLSGLRALTPSPRDVDVAGAGLPGGISAGAVRTAAAWSAIRWFPKKASSAR